MGIPRLTEIRNLLLIMLLRVASWCALRIIKLYSTKTITMLYNFSLFNFLLCLQADLMGEVYVPSWLCSQAGDKITIHSRGQE